MRIPESARYSAFWITPALIWSGVFIGIPLLLLTVTAFAQRGVYGGVIWEWSFQNFERLFDPLYFGVILQSLRLAALSTLACFMLGYPLAYWMVTAGKRIRPWLLLAVLLPFWSNFIVRVYSMKHLLALLPEEWGLLPSEFAVLLGMVTCYLPIFVLPLYAALERMDFSLLEAARDLGARGQRVFFGVLLPQTAPGALTGSIFVFTAALGEFVIPNLLGGARSALIGGVIGDQFLKARDWPFGSSLSLLLLGVSLFSLVLFIRHGEGSARPAGASSTHRPAARRLVKTLSSVALCLLYLPMVILVIGSIRTPQGWGWDWYALALSNPAILEALGRSLRIAAGASLVSAVLGTLAALALARARLPGRLFFQALATAPIVLPELVLGIGALAAFSRMGIELGPLATLCVHVSLSMVYVILTVRSRLLTLHPDLDEAAADLGAGHARAFSRVLFPLILPAVIAGAALSFSVSFDDFLVSFFTLGSTADTLPVKVYSMVRYGVSPEVNAISTLLMGITLAGALIFFRLQRFARDAQRFSRIERR